jgi:hypothetical protein
MTAVLADTRPIEPQSSTLPTERDFSLQYKAMEVRRRQLIEDFVENSNRFAIRVSDYLTARYEVKFKAAPENIDKVMEFFGKLDSPLPWLGCSSHLIEDRMTLPFGISKIVAPWGKEWSLSVIGSPTDADWKLCAKSGRKGKILYEGVCDGGFAKFSFNFSNYIKSRNPENNFRLCDDISVAGGEATYRGFDDKAAAALFEKFKAECEKGGLPFKRRAMSYDKA